MTGLRRLVAVVLLGLAAALVAPAAIALGSPGPTLARPGDMPGVYGLSVVDTRKVLQSWNQGVIITFQPDLKELPNGATESTVVASRAVQVAASPGDLKAAFEPQVIVTLGARMPDLTGMSEQAARAALSDRGLSMTADPSSPPTDWTVSGQSVPAGDVAEFRPPVRVTFAAPAPPPAVVPPAQVVPLPDRRSWLPVSVPVAIAIGAAALVLLILVAALVARGIRRGRRKRNDRDRDRHQRPPERIEVHAFAGQVMGPHVFDLPGAAPVGSVAPREGQS
jgi:hypothetical protein